MLVVIFSMLAPTLTLPIRDSDVIDVGKRHEINCLSEITYVLLLVCDGILYEYQKRENTGNITVLQRKYGHPCKIYHIFLSLFQLLEYASSS